MEELLREPVDVKLSALASTAGSQRTASRKRARSQEEDEEPSHEDIMRTSSRTTRGRAARTRSG
eukprot:3043694-Prymnesium_polylepis.1